jgi:putative ABC transport system ATP-binding protein
VNAPRDETPLVMAEGVGRRAQGSSMWLLRDVHLQLWGGEQMAVVGASGSGKTLLLRSLALLDPLDAGRILYQGRAVRGEAIPAYRARVVYLHQRPALGEGTVEENLREPYTFRMHRDRQFDRPRIVGWLRHLDRDEAFLTKLRSQLSGGEALIAALLRAIQLEPEVLLLDEPTAALDQAAQEAVESLVTRWHGEQPGRAVLWVTHDLQQARRVAGRRLHMDSGQLREE